MQLGEGDRSRDVHDAHHRGRDVAEGDPQPDGPHATQTKGCRGTARGRRAGRPARGAWGRRHPPDRARGGRPRPSQIETAAPRPRPTLAATLKSAHLRPGVGGAGDVRTPAAGGQPRPRGRGRCTRPAGPRPATPPSPAVPSAVPPRAKGPTDEGRPASRLQLPTPAGGRARPWDHGAPRRHRADRWRRRVPDRPAHHRGPVAGEVRRASPLHDRPRERRLDRGGRRGRHPRRGRRPRHPAPAGDLWSVPGLP